MRLIVIIILAWFAVTAVVMPVLAPQEGVDIWTTDNFGEIAAALRSPIDYAVDLAEFLGGFIAEEPDTSVSVWEWVLMPPSAAGKWIGYRVAELITGGSK